MNTKRICALLTIASLGAGAFPANGQSPPPNVYTEVMNSVVMITVKGFTRTARDYLGYGTGFLVDSEGDVLTAKHLIPAREDFVSYSISGSVGVDAFRSPKHELTVVSPEPDRDIAVLRFLDFATVGPASGMRPLSVGDASKTMPDNQIAIAGFDGGGGLRVHRGNVSGYDSTGALWSVDVSIQPGTSGAPMLPISGGANRMASVGVTKGAEQYQSNSLPVGASGLVTPINRESEVMHKIHLTQAPPNAENTFVQLAQYNGRSARNNPDEAALSPKNIYFEDTIVPGTVSLLKATETSAGGKVLAFTFGFSAEEGYQIKDIKLTSSDPQLRILDYHFEALGKQAVITGRAEASPASQWILPLEKWRKSPLVLDTTQSLKQSALMVAKNEADRSLPKHRIESELAAMAAFPADAQSEATQRNPEEPLRSASERNSAISKLISAANTTCLRDKPFALEASHNGGLLTLTRSGASPTEIVSSAPSMARDINHQLLAATDRDTAGCVNLFVSGIRTVSAKPVTRGSEQ